jgi:hypothetical protein
MRCSFSPWIGVLLGWLCAHIPLSLSQAYTCPQMSSLMAKTGLQCVQLVVCHLLHCAPGLHAYLLVNGAPSLPSHPPVIQCWCRLWVAGGPPADTSRTAFLACAAQGADGAWAPAADVLPPAVCQALEAQDGSEEAAAAAAAAAARERRALVAGYLKAKRRYTEEDMAQHKAHRRDMRAKRAKAEHLG